MKDKLKAFWTGGGRWFLASLPLAALVLGLAVWRANSLYQAPEKRIADPLAESEVTFDLEKNRAYTAEDGIVVIGPAGAEEQDGGRAALLPVTDPEQVWEEAVPLSTENYTLPEEAALEDGSIGTLTIPKIGLTAPVFETEEQGGELESMTKGVAHFAITSAWDGNIGLSSHNVAPEGAAAFFGDIHLLKQGDALTYRTAQGERQYQVTEIKEIAEDDWSYLMRYEDGRNRITMITCITGKPNRRLMVQVTAS